MVGNTPRDRMGLRVREGEHISFSGILGILRQGTCTAITLAQGSEGVNLLGTKAAEIAGNGNGRGNKSCRQCGVRLGLCFE